MVRTCNRIQRSFLLPSFQLELVSPYLSSILTRASPAHRGLSHNSALPFTRSACQDRGAPKAALPLVHRTQKPSPSKVIPVHTLFGPAGRTGFSVPGPPSQSPPLPPYWLNTSNLNCQSSTHPPRPKLSFSLTRAGRGMGGSGSQ